MIYVTNNSDQDLRDGFGGVFYDFKKGATVEISEEAARHIFGYGKEDKTTHLARLGWIKTANDFQGRGEKSSRWQHDLWSLNGNSIDLHYGSQTITP
jgi:hypothetical protein